MPIPTASDFVQARNHLLVLMSLTNAEISGVLINLSLSTNSIKCTELLQRSMVTPATSGSVTLHRPDVTDATSSVSQNEERGCQMQKRVIWNRQDRDIVRNKFMTFVKREKTPIVENDSVLNRDTALWHRLEASLGIRAKVFTRAVSDKVCSFFRWTKSSHWGCYSLTWFWWIFKDCARYQVKRHQRQQ